MTAVDALKITTLPRTFSPVDHCIYCASATKTLGKEHIVPYGLAGNSLILPKASCRDCETVTGKIEQIVLKQTFGSIRNTLGLPTHNKKDRKSEIPVTKAYFEPGALESHSSIATSLSAKEYPLHFVGLLMDAPGMISGYPPFEPLPWQFYTATSTEDLERVNPEFDVAMRIAAINPYVFAQFLAKVGHSYAVATYGYGAFEPLLVDLIFGRTKRFRPWIGGEAIVPPSDVNALHLISTSKIRRGEGVYVLVKMRFFCLFPSPIYYALAGRLL